MTQLETADRLGYDHAWVRETSFLRNIRLRHRRESSRRGPQASAPKISGSGKNLPLTHHHPRALRKGRGAPILTQQRRCVIRAGRESPRSTGNARHRPDMETKRKDSRKPSTPCYPMLREGGAASITAPPKYSDLPCASGALKPVQSTSPVCGWRVRASAIERSGQNGWGAGSLSLPTGACPGCTTIKMPSPGG